MATSRRSYNNPRGADQYSATLALALMGSHRTLARLASEDCMEPPRPHAEVAIPIASIVFGTNFAGEQCSASVLPSPCKGEGEGEGEGSEEERARCRSFSLILTFSPGEIA